MKHLAGLNRPWWEGLALVTERGIPGPHNLASDIIDIARWFIVNHAKQAEKFGFQPAHLLSQRGLARLWAPAFFAPAHVRFERGVIVYPLVSGLIVAREAADDGSTPLITGERLTAVRGRHLAMEAVSA